MNTHWYLHSKDFFDGIAREKALFLAQAQTKILAKNDMIFFEGDTGTACFYIASGLVRIFSLTDSGKEPIFFLRRQGEMFGLSEVVDACSRKANAQALTPVVLHRIERDAFERLLAENYLLTRKVISVMGARIRYLGDRISALIACTVRHRLIKLLLSLAYEHLPDAASWQSAVTIDLLLSQEQIAALTGSTQPTISDALQHLQREGLIALSRRHITVLKPLALLELAEFGQQIP
ncbi:MAG: Crp/Fnr family transcriptional regulator [Desulfovibrionaceae bacterium]